MPTTGESLFTKITMSGLFAIRCVQAKANGKFSAPGLYWLRRRCNRIDPLEKTTGVSVTAGEQEIILVASVPLADEAWQPFGEGDVIEMVNGRVAAPDKLLQQ